MKIAMFYPDKGSVGRNDGPPLFWTYNLRKIFGKENVIHLLPRGDISCFGKFDLHVWVDFGDDAINIGTDWVCPKPNVYITSDTHLGYDYRLRKARDFDLVLCNQKRAMEEFVRDGIPKKRCFWFPHAFEPDCYKPFNIVKKYDVCFVGHLANEARVRALDALFKAIPNFYWGVKFFEEAAKTFSQTKVVFNYSVGDDANMRLFESLGTKSFLLTNWIPTLGELFEDGKHLVTYKTIEEAIEKVTYYVENDQEREEIAQAGYDEVMKNHTYRERVEQMLEIIGIKEVLCQK